MKKLEIDTATEETLWVEVKTKTSFILGTIYRANYTNLLSEDENGTELETQLTKAISKSTRTILLGDLNCDTSSEIADKSTQTLKDVCESHSMNQLITKPTRIDLETNKSTTIDHIWANSEDKLIKECGTIEGISDHVGLYVQTNITKPKPEESEIRYRNYKNYCEEKFNDELKEAIEKSSLNSLIEADLIDEATELWIKIFKKTANKHAPLVVKRKSKRMRKIPWSNENLETLTKEKTKKLQLYRLYGLFTDLKMVKVISNKITHLKRKLKKSYFTEKINSYEGDSKKIWKVMKEVTNTEEINNTTEPNFLNQNVTNNFNKFFATVGTRIKEKLKVKKEETREYNDANHFTLQEETEESIIKLIDKIKIDVAVGHDDINAKLIKDSKHTIADSLKRLVNLSYKTSKFPNCLKIAIVKAIHKKGDTEDPSNYRPLSILPIVSKIFERSATNQLVKYLEDHKLITDTQHAYRKGHSTQTCLNEIVDYIYEENDKGNIVGIASLDLSKAFDSIDHDLLLQKLRNLGLQGTSLAWCESYLTNREQKTKFRNYESTTETVTSGVPQGSILGPILFICFMNNLPKEFNDCKIMSYADDTQIIVSGKSIEEIKSRIESLIQAAQEWYTENSLLNNASKTEIMIISKRKRKESFEIMITENGKLEKLKPKTSIKVLGVYLDNELNWNKQVNEVNKKARYASRNLQRTNHILPFKPRLILYNSLVASHFNYADTVWGGCNNKNKNKLQRTQNSAIKSMLGMKLRDSTTEALDKAKLLTLEEKRNLHCAVYVQKALSDKLPRTVCQKYQQHQSLKNHRSANKQILTIPKHKTENFKNSPLYRTITAWNSTPEEIKKSETVTFKKKLQSHIQNKVKI